MGQAITTETVTESTVVRVTSVRNPNFAFPYLITCVQTAWTILKEQTLTVTFTIDNQTGTPAQFPDKELAVKWVSGKPPNSEVQSQPAVLLVQQKNEHSGTGNLSFDFHIGVEIEGTVYYSFDPTIINSPVGG